MKLPAWAWAVAAIVVVLIGFFFVKQPKPIIELKPEALWTLGGFKITNTILTAWLVILLLAVVLIAKTRRLSLIPSGFQNLFEAIVEGYTNLVTNIAGEGNGRRFFALVFSIFFYIVVANWLSLTPLFNVIGLTDDVFEEIHHQATEDPGHTIKDAESVDAYIMRSGGLTLIKPGAKDVKVEIPAGATFSQRAQLLDHAVAAKVGLPENATTNDIERHMEEHHILVGKLAPFLRGVNSDLNSTLSYAVWSAIFVELWGITTLGVLGYGSKFFNFRRLFKGDVVNGLIDVFVGLLELVSEFARLISFTFRLFGNIFAGEVLLFMMAFLVPFLLVDVFYALELFVGLVQAFVFSMLTLVFAVLAVSGHGDHEEHGEGHGGHDAAHQAVHA